MWIFSIFRRKKQNLNSVSAISRKIFELKNEDPSKKRSRFDINADIQNLHKKLAEMLFDAVAMDDLNTINDILRARFVNRNELVDGKGYNIVDYCLFNDRNELFRYLYDNLYEELKSCFGNIPVLFTIILNRKNFDLIEYFLKETNLSDSLKVENVTNCLFVALQNNKKPIIDLIVNNFGDMLDSRNIEATMIYSISYAQTDELKMIFSYPSLISKFSSAGVEKMLALSVMNRNANALEVMTSNDHFMQSIENSDRDILRGILQIAYDNGNVAIVRNFMNNNRLKSDVKEILRIGKESDEGIKNKI